MSINPDTTPLISARGLTKRFGSFIAVDAIDFDVAPGEAFGFLGPNGAGKTSTMRMIGCTSPSSGGSLTVLGMDPATQGSEIRGRLGVVPQADTLDEELSVRENLLIYGRYFGLSRAECAKRADTLLDFAQLTERRDSRVEPLSGGMKRRLTIARSLINEPDMHRLILGSTLPAAEKFERWVFEEVLPAIRKTGSYSIQNQFNIPTTYAGAMRLAADQAEQIEQQQLLLSMSETLVKQAIAETNEVLEKVSDFKDKRGCGKTYATINEVVKATGITYTYGPLKRWCIKNKIDRQEVYLTTEVFTHSYPAGAWRAAYGLDIDLLFETV